MSHTDSSSAETVKFAPVYTGRERPRPFSHGTKVEVAGRTHQGLVRQNNEDHFLICRYGRFLEPIDTNLPSTEIPDFEKETGYGFALADGMGGAAAGEVASRLVLASLLNLVLATPDWYLRFDEPEFAERAVGRATERLQQIKQLLVEESAAEPTLRGFGTTFLIAWGVGRTLFVLHVGDSRCYLYREGQLHRITRDQTIAQRLADEGQIRQEEVSQHHLRNVLSQCIGDRGAVVQPEIHQLALEDGDILLLCSDGLTDMVPDGRISKTLAQMTAVEEACTNLLELALDAGGKDNVTVLVARYRFTDSGNLPTDTSHFETS